jgi:hypothetical protein
LSASLHRPKHSLSTGAVVLAVLVLPSPAAAETRSYPPVRVTHSMASFKLVASHPRRVESARLRVGRRYVRRLSVRRVRAGMRRGRLRVRIPRRVTASRTKRRLREQTVLRITFRARSGQTDSSPLSGGGVKTTGCAGSGSAYSDTVQSTAGLVSYWRLGEQSGNSACDAKGLNSGTYRDAFVLGAGGAIASDADTAVALDGGEVRMASSSSLQKGGPLSLEAWVRPDSASPSQTVVRKQGEYLLRIAGGRLIFRLWRADGSHLELVSPAVVQGGAYQHVVGSFDGAAMRLYRNGDRLASRAFDGSAGVSSHSFRLGSSGGNDQLRGRLDEVALYAGAMSSATIAAHYTAGHQATSPTPLPDPDPAPSPGPSGCSPAFGAFGVGSWPSGCWRPYGAASPWNRAVPAAPRLRANSAAIVKRIRGFSPYIDDMTAGIPRAYDWQHPTYWPKASDPSYTVHCTRPWGTCSVEGLKVRIPQEALAPPTTNDGHLTVVDQETGWEWDFYDAETPLPTGGGTVTIGWGGRTRIDGDGLGSDATAARFGNLAGVIRAQEAISGRIDHALFMVLSCDDGSFVYPAMKKGAACADRTNAPPMGSHMWLDMSETEIDALSAPAWQKMILRTLHRYGAFMGDTGGPGWGYQFESPLTYRSFGVEDALLAWAEANGWIASNGSRVGRWSNVPDDVWGRIRILDPCVSKGTC